MNSVIDRIRREPAAFIGLLVSVAACFEGGVSLADAVPVATGLVIRFFVTPASA